MFFPRGQDDVATIGHGVAGVQAEIEESQLQLIGVHFDWLEESGKRVSMLNDGPMDRCRSSVMPRTSSGMPITSFLSS